MTDVLTYDDYLQRVDIQDVLRDAGYQFYRRDGLKYPSYIRLDSDGRKVSGDKFIVNSGGWGCFHPPEQKVYNVVSFIKEHPEMFKDYKPGMDKNHLVNLVCRRLLNEPMPDREARNVIPGRNPKPFRLSDYEIQRFDPRPRYDFNQKAFDRWFGPRGINHETQKIFKDYFFLAKKIREKGLPAYANLSFPLTIPGKDGIVGLEERGRVMVDGSSFKGKAEGSNGSEGLWIANLSGLPLDKVSNVMWFESAYDAMAEYQLDKYNDMTRVTTAYVSTGGNPTGMQIRGMLAATPNAHHYLGFDRDMAGKQFIANFRSIADSMGIPKENVGVHQPEGYHKDWNDALLGKKDMTLKGVVCDYDYKTDTYHRIDDADDNPQIDNVDVNGLDLTEYLASLRKEGDIFSGDTDLLPKPLGDLYGRYEYDCEEWLSSKESGLVCHDDVQYLHDKAEKSHDAYREAMTAAVSDHMRRVNAGVDKTEEKGKEVSNDNEKTARRGYHR